MSNPLLYRAWHRGCRVPLLFRLCPEATSRGPDPAFTRQALHPDVGYPCPEEGVPSSKAQKAAM